MKRLSKKQRLRDLIAARAWPRIGETEWIAILAAIPNISPNDLQAAGVPVDPPWSGVRQHTLEELDDSLCGLSEVYAARLDLRTFCRRQAIVAKDRARGASRSDRVDPERRQLKAEMVEWLLVWLGDPAVFPSWARLRRTRMRET